MGRAAEVRAWRPDASGIAEVLHARFTEHAYPSHTHRAWTLLIVDDGAVRYELGRHEHGALRSLVTLLPPHVPHDGRAATPHGFRKRVLYLEPDFLDERLIGAAVDHPELPDPLLRHRIHQLHQVLVEPGEHLEVQSRLELIRERLTGHVADRGHIEYDARRRPTGGTSLAGRLRDLLDANVVPGVRLADAATLLGAHPTHLVRAFTAAYRMPPHRYLTGRRVDLARAMLLDGHPVAEAATAAGFADQPHLTRHFKRTLGTTPARFRAGC